MKNINCLASKRGVLSAFTLAEMMVVMLILSIVLAAMAPVMTTRNKPNNSSPWKYEGNQRQNAWFGAGAAQKATIGQSETRTGDIATKLQITLGSGDTTTSLLAFKRGDTQLGRLYMNNDGGIMFGSTPNVLGANANAVGRQVSAFGTSSSAFGSVATATGNNSTAVGSTVTASGANSIAIGTSTTASGNSAIAIGNTVTASGQESTALGEHSRALTAGTTALGRYAYADQDYATALGTRAEAKSNDSVAVGYLAKVPEKATGAIAIGSDINASAKGAIAIGRSGTFALSAEGVDSIAIGSSAQAQGEGSIAIGPAFDNDSIMSNIIAKKIGAIAIGQGAQALESESIAFGYNAAVNSRSTGAMYYGKPSIAIGYNTVATPGSEEQGISVAIGAEAVASKGGIAIGSKYYKGTSAIMATGSQSIAIGQGAYASNTNNIAIGRNACSNVTGANKICIGANSGPKADSTEATGNEEMIFLGSAPKWGPIRGGDWAKNAVMVIHNTDGSKVNIGSRRGANESGPTVYINGNLVVRGYTYTVGRGDDENETEPIGVLGNKNGDLNGDQVKWYSMHWPSSFFPSDRRLKYVGKENTSGLDKIRQLKIFNYTYKKDTTKTPHVGVIAQDLQKVFPNAVKKGADGFLTIRMEDMFYAVINAIKELDAKYQAQEKRINELEKRIEVLEAKTK